MRLLCLLSALILSLISLGYVALKPHEHVIDDSWSDESALKLTLNLIKRPTNDLSQSTLRLTVKNTSPKPIVLDSECLCGFRLQFEIDRRDPDSDEDAPVSLQELRQLPKPPPGVGRTRFVPLEPGRSISRSWDLSGPVPYVVEGHRTDLQRVHRGFFYEAEGRYQIPQNVRQITIRARYRGDVWFTAIHAFNEWFGVNYDELKLWNGQAESNAVVIVKANP
jgi:hypothetical protein